MNLIRDTYKLFYVVLNSDDVEIVTKGCFELKENIDNIYKYKIRDILEHKNKSV